MFPSYDLILMRSFVGHYGYPEYDLPASRLPVKAEGCGEITALHSVSRYSPQCAQKVARAKAERDAAHHEASMLAWMPMRWGVPGRR